MDIFNSSERQPPTYSHSISKTFWPFFPQNGETMAQPPTYSHSISKTFWPFFPQNGETMAFSENRPPSLFCIYDSLTSCQKLEKSLEPFQRKVCHGITNWLTDGSDFIGPCPPRRGSNKDNKVNKDNKDNKYNKNKKDRGSSVTYGIFLFSLSVESSRVLSATHTFTRRWRFIAATEGKYTLHILQQRFFTSSLTDGQYVS